MIAWLLGLGMSERAARLAMWGAIVASILLLGTCAVLRIRQDAVRDERREVAAAQAIADAAQRANERAADVIFRDAQARERALTEQRRKEIDDATRNLPDQAPSDRQRVRACLELRRQAEAAGEPAPAC